MEKQIKEQRLSFEDIYSPDKKSKYDFHITTDPLTRYLRDRRLEKGLDLVRRKVKEDTTAWKVLIVCGGVGGEGIFFLKNGFVDVTVSDISENSLRICNELSYDIRTIPLNGESLALPDNSYDLVVVQDGLHHLPRPATGFTEMLRVARKAVMVVEPYDSFVGNLIGTEWEVNGNAINYVFRWNKNMVKQTVKSYLLTNYSLIKVLRFWDHNVVIGKMAKRFPKRLQLFAAKSFYSFFNLFKPLGNMMVAVVLK